MDYFTDRYPSEWKDSYLFLSGYRDATLKFLKLSEPLIQTMMSCYPNLFEPDELDPNRHLYLAAALLIENSYLGKKSVQTVYQRIFDKRDSGILDQQKELHKISPEQYPYVLQSYELMASDLNKTRHENEELKKTITEFEEKIQSYKKLISGLQDELDGVRYSGQ